MGEQWDGLPQSPERDGWHWLRYRNVDDSPFAADPIPRMWIAGGWVDLGGNDLCTPEGAAHRCEYLGPCELPPPR